MENIFPSCLGFAKLGVKNETQAVYQVNDDFKYHVKLLDEIFYLDEYHYGNIVKSSKGKSLKEAFVNHYRNYDPMNCPIQEAWISKVMSIPFVYADYITKDDLSSFSYNHLCNIDIRLPLLEENLSIAEGILEEIIQKDIARGRIYKCLHITVYPENVLQSRITVLAIKIPIINVYSILKVCWENGLMIKEKRFRAIVNRSHPLKSFGVRIFNGGKEDDWLRYVICFEEV
jgi:hypothetical protein